MIFQHQIRVIVYDTSIKLQVILIFHTLRAPHTIQSRSACHHHIMSTLFFCMSKINVVDFYLEIEDWKGLIRSFIAFHFNRETFFRL